MFHHFDIHKRNQRMEKEDWSWHWQVEEFIEQDKNRGGFAMLSTTPPTLQDQSLNAATTIGDIQSSSAAEHQQQLTETEEDKLLNEMHNLRDAKNQMTAFHDPIARESQLPIQVLYNAKIERIRVLEYERHSVPLPIKFDVSDGYSGVPSQKIIKIQSESAPKAFTFDVDLASDKNPRIYDTQLEKFNR